MKFFQIFIIFFALILSFYEKVSAYTVNHSYELHSRLIDEENVDKKVDLNLPKSDQELQLPVSTDIFASDSLLSNFYQAIIDGLIQTIAQNYLKNLCNFITEGPFFELINRFFAIQDANALNQVIKRSKNFLTDLSNDIEEQGFITGLRTIFMILPVYYKNITDLYFHCLYFFSSIWPALVKHQNLFKEYQETKNELDFFLQRESGSFWNDVYGLTKYSFLILLSIKTRGVATLPSLYILETIEKIWINKNAFREITKEQIYQNICQEKSIKNCLFTIWGQQQAINYILAFL